MDKKPRSSANKLAWIGLLLSIAGGVSYALLLDVPWIRATAIPNSILAVAGLLLSIFAVVKRRSATTVIAGVLSVAISAGFLASVHILMQLPPGQGVLAVGEAAPDFALPNQDGEDVRLSSFKGRGPVLLVFYRGHW